MKSFKDCSYQAQVLRLRKLAQKAISRFPLRVASIEFINYGENATFKVQAQNGKKYLLRIHREDYHTVEAINEELSWLEHLNQKTSLLLPSPIRSKNNFLIESVAQEGVPTAKNCCV